MRVSDLTLLEAERRATRPMGSSHFGGGLGRASTALCTSQPGIHQRLEDFGLDAGERAARRLQLRQQVLRVAIGVKHARNAADLTFEPAQSIAESGLVG